MIINLSPSGRVDIREGLAKRTRPRHPCRHSGQPGCAEEAQGRACHAALPCIGRHKSLAVQELSLANPRKAKKVAVIAVYRALK